MKKYIANKTAQLILYTLTKLEQLLKLILRLIIKFREMIYIATIVVLALSLVLSLTTTAEAPKADMSKNRVSKPLTEHQQIVNYINEVFGKEAKTLL